MTRKGTKTTEQFKEEIKEINPNIEVLGEYVTNSTKILVRDKRCGHEWNSTTPSRLLAGGECPECAKFKRWDNRYVDRTGEIKYNRYKNQMTIIRYNGVHDIDVKFKDGSIVKNMQYSSFKKGQLMSPYDKTICGIGYLGEGKYSPTKNGETTHQYYTWLSMMKRCYDEKQQQKQPTYKGCLVVKEWHNFQIFAQWWDDNYYEISEQRMEVDKDILHKGNKIYSPDNCIFVSSNINALIINCKKVRGDYPIGVNIIESGKFRSRYSDAILGTRFHLGCFITPEEAFEVYKVHKEKHIKNVADYYKNQIPKKLYDALYDWKIEIDD